MTTKNRGQTTQPIVPDEELRKQFGRKLAALKDIIGGGIACLSAWRGLVTEDEGTVAALNRYPGFFVPAHAALKGVALLHFAKVFDRNPRTASLRILLREAKANRAVLTPHASEQELLAIEALIQTREPIIKSLKHLRDTRIAHYDALVPTSMSLTYGNVLQLVDDAKAMYNVLRRGHYGSGVSFGYLGGKAQEGTSAVVRIMCEERDRARQQCEEAMKLIESR